MKAYGLAAFGLVVGLPVLVSVPTYWLYSIQTRSRVFIWIGATLWLGLTILAFAINIASSAKGVVGYSGLVLAVMVSILGVVWFRAHMIRRYAHSSDELRRSRKDRSGSIGVALGFTVGAALLRVLAGRLPPEFQAAVGAFIVSWGAFSLLGCAGWYLFWELIRQQ